MLRKGDLTQGGITGTLLHFTLPMMVGSFLQQCYNIADTLIVGQCIGAGALAAVGSAYTLMVFLISVLQHSVIYISAGVRGLQIRIAPQDLLRFVGGETAEISRPSSVAAE